MLSDKPFEVPAYLKQRAIEIAPVRASVAGADSRLVLESVQAAHALNIIEPVLVGDRSAIAAHAHDLGFDISDFEIIAADSEAEASQRAVEVIRRGDARMLIKGQVHTDAMMRAVIDKERGLRTGARLSHIFHMTVPGSERVLNITDAAVNVAPDVESFMHIARNAVALSHRLGVAEPKVAVLSATEVANASMPSSLVARDVVERAMGGRNGGGQNGGGEIKGAVFGGPFAFDNAVSPRAAELKGIEHAVAGSADILLVPNIETGNGLFKMMVWFMGATAAGVVMGARVPIVLTSRADPPEARLSAAIIAALAAQNGKT